MKLRKLKHYQLNRARVSYLHRPKWSFMYSESLAITRGMHDLMGALTETRLTIEKITAVPEHLLRPVNNGKQPTQTD